MIQAPLSETLVAAFDGMPAQMRKAARHLLDHPSDVALLSMREQARRAGVRPAPMTRLAQSLGFPGYDALRALYAEALRDGPGFAAKADAQIGTQKLQGDHGLAAAMLGTLAGQISSLAAPEALGRIAEVAARMARARRVYVLGLRSSHAIAWQLHYVLSLIGGRAVLLDGVGGTGSDPIRHAGAEDLLFVVGVRPYTRAVSHVAAYARSRGVPVAALTDSPVSPLAAGADAVILVPTSSPSFFHAMAPAFALAEVLAALVAGRSGKAGLDSLRGFDAQLATFDTYLSPEE